ncbi:MAG: 2-oxoadipate dioxygenase/decarboxylase family protein, partial [Planctomycetota bacterium]
GVAARQAGTPMPTDLMELVRLGFADYEGLRYEDFLPVSAAGIFASNLEQYGTKSTATVRPTYSQSQLEAIMGKPIVDSTAAYAGMEAESMLSTWRQLGLIDRVPDAERRGLEQAVADCPPGVLRAETSAGTRETASTG